MEMIPDETVLSCPEYPSAAFDKLIEATLFQRPTRPLQGRILRVPTIRRRRSVQSSQESGVPQDLQVSLNVSPRSTIRSASTDPWSTSGFVEDESVMDRSGDELGDSDALVEPKLESPDNDVQMDDLLEAASMSTSTPTPGDSELEPRARRPRGRPRKHPVPSSEVVTKVQKGRSKTGCITCRRRKKKCDETKPSCLNCEKNAVICEGYLDKRFWRSGKERGEEAQRRRFSVPNIQNITLAPIIHGVVTPSDRIFLQHYCFRLSVVLTVEGPRRNAFKDMLLPMAVQHLGLMHSILALSSSNLDYDEPYGRALLAEHPELNVQMMKERAQYHHEEAMKEFYASVDRENDGIVSESTLCVRYGQMLCLVVQSLAKGTATGEHRIHLQAYQELIKGGPPDPGPFMQFIEEFFQFHIGLDDIISLPPGSLRLGAIGDDWNLPAVIQPEAVRLLGVQDGLFFLMSKITSVRNSIRANMEQGIDPVVDYTSLYRAAEIDAGIRAWQPSWPEGDSRELAGTLYKQMMWVYLWRTIYPPKTTTWQPEYKITVVVNQGIEILGKFPPKSQVQTLLLSPTFLIGCAAFDPAQRGPIRKSIAIIKAYTHLKNTDLALEVLEQVWKYMDDKDERSWDWQGVAHDMGRDFLAT